MANTYTVYCNSGTEVFQVTGESVSYATDSSIEILDASSNVVAVVPACCHIKVAAV